ncbi:hypothetical protein WJS89_03155 [Sphingomicrobium sp. XHP0235]|uniref:hypothetical protein n=1 Tax=Sphingomicrobium aquimarinum TaxID=3133971 RepID=UPI0031FF14A8
MYGNKKEKKKQKRTLRDQETRKLHKEANKKRGFRDASFDSLIDPLVSGLERNGRNFDAAAFYQWKLHQILYADTPPGEYAMRLFDPSIKSVHVLAFGLLTHRLDTIPDELIPQQGDLETDLRILCERMITRDRDEGLIERTIEGWGGKLWTETEMENHVDQLIDILRVDRRLYLSIVSGRHWEVVEALAHDKIPQALSPEAIKRILFRQGHLWCAHDVQLVVARNRFYEKFLVEGVVEHDKEVLRVKTYFDTFKEAFSQLERFCAIQNFEGSERKAAEEKFLDDLEKSKLKDLKSSLETSVASTSLADDPAVFVRLEEIEREIASRVDNPTSELMKILSGQTDPDSLTTTFHKKFFGFTNLKATALCVMRLLQFEVEGAGMIDSAVEAARKEGTPIFAPMGRFSDGEKFSQKGNRAGSSLKDRFTALLWEVRRVLLEDINESGDEPIKKSYEEFKVAIKNIRVCEKTDAKFKRFDRDEILMIDVLPDRRLQQPSH